MKGTAIQLNGTQDQGVFLDLKPNIVLDQEGKVLTGFSFGAVTDQNVAVLLIARPGELKQYPSLGVALVDATLSDDLLEYRHIIREQFKRDSLTIQKLELYDLKNVQIKANY